MLKLSPITAQQRREDNIDFFRVTKIVKCWWFGWNDERFDMGLNELTYQGDQPPQRIIKCERRQILDSNKLPVQKPMPLNGKGKSKPNATDLSAVLVCSGRTSGDRGRA